MIKKVVVSGFNTENSYFYINEKTNHGFLIDPGFEGDKLLDIIRSNNWIIEAILITHGHFDHIGEVNFLKKTLNCEVYAGEKASIYLEKPENNLGYYSGLDIVISDYKILKDGEKITLKDNQNFYLKVMNTPGHTADGVIYYNEDENIAFVGDTIFKGTHGRTDLPGSSEDDMQNSLKKILNLNKKMILYPGHGEETTVENECKNF